MIPPHSNFFSGSFIFFNFFFSFSSRNNSRSLLVRVAAFAINFERWFILPREDLSCFSDFGCSNFIMASVFVTLGVTLLSDNLCPSRLNSDLKKLAFGRFKR